MTLQLSDWAALAEIFSAMALIVSLTFVGAQIRENTKATHAATLQDHMGYEMDFVTRIGADPKLARLWDMTLKDFESLGGNERIQGTYLLLGAMRLWEGYYLQWRAGTLSNDGWKAREPLVRNFARLRMPAFGGASPNDEVFSGPFMEYIRQVRKEEGIKLAS
jgi:hypothetical protein